MAVTLDTLELDISVNAEGASGKIRSLANSISHLGNILHTVQTPLSKLSDTLKGISNLHLDKIGKLTDIGDVADKAKSARSAIGELTTTVNVLGNRVEMNLPRLHELAKVLTTIGKARASAMRKTESLAGTGAQTPTVGSVSAAIGTPIGEVKQQAEEATEEVEQLNEAIGNLKVTEKQREPYRFFNSDAEMRAAQAANAETARARLAAVAQQRADALTRNPEYADFERRWEQARAGRTGAEQQAESVASAAQTMSNVTEQAQQAMASVTGQTTQAMSNVAAETAQATSSVSETANAMGQLSEQAENAADATQQAAEGTRECGDEAERTRERVGGLRNALNRIGRVVWMRALRSALMGLTSGIGEGIKNLYHYSDAINGKFASAMDKAASQTMLLKNSVATALAPAIQAMIPILTWIVARINDVCNAISQLHAILTGADTWTAAIETVEDYDDAATSASKATKNLLADWDELNVIQSNGGGSSSGKSKTDYSKMFTEMSEFSKVLEGVADWMDLIGASAAVIGAAVLGWKLSRGFTGGLSNALAMMAAITTSALTIHFTWAFDDDYVKSGDPGFVVKDLLINALGATIAGKIAESVIGGNAGYYTAGITLLLSAGVSFIKSKEAAVSSAGSVLNLLSVISSVKAAIGAALVALGLTGSTTVAIVAGVIVLPLTLLVSMVVNFEAKKKTSYKRMAQEAFAKAGEGGISPEAYLAALQKEFDGKVKGFKLSVDAFTNVPDIQSNLQTLFKDIDTLTKKVNGEGSLTKEEAETFKSNWNTVLETISSISTSTNKTIDLGLAESVETENDNLRTQIEELQKNLVTIESLTNGAMSGLKLEMNQLANKIALGNFSEDDLAKYNEYATALAKYSDTSLDGLRGLQGKVKTLNFDFGNTDEAVANAMNFLNEVTAARTDAEAQVDEWLNTETAAIAEKKKELDLLLGLHKIGKEQYDAATQMYDETLAAFKLVAEERKTEIANEADKAVQMIDDQFVDAFSNIDLADGSTSSIRSKIEAFYNVINDVIKESGIDEDALENSLAVLEKLNKFTDSTFGLKKGNPNRSQRNTNREAFDWMLKPENFSSSRQALSLLGFNYSDLEGMFPSGTDTKKYASLFGGVGRFFTDAFASATIAIPSGVFDMKNAVNDLAEELKERTYQIDVEGNVVYPEADGKNAPVPVATQNRMNVEAAYQQYTEPEKTTVVDTKGLADEIGKQTSESIATLKSDVKDLRSAAWAIYAKNPVIRVTPTAALGKALESSQNKFQYTYER